MARTLVYALMFAALRETAPPPPHTNRLGRESSPYLLQHAHNPVNWYPWGPEAFERAKKEGKYVFLSIGYSSCHWCHVMEKESFSNDEVAKILNDNYVCIKVDREERPDIDQIYMTALNVLGQRGGWPLSMWLTAEGKPIVGGTYWPREDRGEVPGFKSVLKLVLDLKRDKPDEVAKNADNLAKATVEALAAETRGVALVDLDRKLVTATVEAVVGQFDKEHGGFGSPARAFRGPKFPSPPSLQLLQLEAQRTKSKDLADAVALTLDRMARGGIYDHLGGGFHRYSTERTWTVPHFEKMLYDNAQLLELYARAHRDTKLDSHARVLRETLAFVARELTSPEGVYYSALDADSEGEEGRFYVWNDRELKSALGESPDGKVFREVYGLDGEYNFEKTHHILTLPRSLVDQAGAMKCQEAELVARLEAPRRQLFETRGKRPRPFLDTKVLTAWNGQMIAGVAVAGQALGDKAALAGAAKAADFVLKNLRTKDGRLLRVWGAAPGQKASARLPGYLDDYAYLIHGLLCLHDVTGESRWLDASRALADTMTQFHEDAAHGGFYYTANDHEKLFARAKDQYDGAQPSGNSVAARDLVRLWQKTGDAKYGKSAERTLHALAAPLKANPTSLPALAEAMALWLDVSKK